MADVGGPAHLAQCVEDGVLASNLLAYARQVRDASRKREMAQLGAAMLAGGMTPSEVAAKLDEMPGPVTAAIYDPATDWAAIVERWGQAQILTGLRWLDHLTQGITLGNLIVIGGRPSHGKTALSVDLSRMLAKAGHHVDYLTLEEPSKNITRRLVAGVTGIKSYLILTGHLSPGEIEACEDAVRQLQSLPLTITDLNTIRNLDEDAVVSFVLQSKAQIVFVDHLQKINTRGESRVYGLERVLNRLHAVGIKHQKAVIVLSQLSRMMESEKRAPALRDLRDSGGTEQSARQVWLLLWPIKMDPDKYALNEYKLEVAKNSDGPTGSVTLHYEPACGRFSTPAGEVPPPEESSQGSVGSGEVPF